MKTSAFITSALLVLSGLSGADITFYTVFESDISEAGSRGVIEVPDGGYAVISCNISWTFARTDSVGEVLAQHSNHVGYTMCLTDAGELVVGSIYMSPDSILLHWTDQMGVVNRSRCYYVIGSYSCPDRMITTSDCGYAICGGVDYGDRGFLLRVDDQENILWATLFDTQDLMCLVETADSGFVVGGSVDSDGSLTWVDAEGIEGQTRLYEEGYFNGIVSTSTGYAMSLWDGYVMGVDHTGNIEWCYTSSDIEHYSDLCLADNGDVVAVGHYWEDYYSGITRLNPDDGTLVWERYYPDCLLYRLTAAADGGFAAVGVFPGYPYDDIILIKTDSEGLCPEMGIEEGVNPRVDICLQVFPNPCSGSSSVRFTLSETAVVQLSVYDLSGRLVEDLINTSAQAGDHTILWNPDHTIPDGCYLFALDTCGKRTVRRAVLLR